MLVSVRARGFAEGAGSLAPCAPSFSADVSDVDKEVFNSTFKLITQTLGKLSGRSKYAEDAFLELYQCFKKAPDPTPLLQVCGHWWMTRVGYHQHLRQWVGTRIPQRGAPCAVRKVGCFPPPAATGPRSRILQPPCPFEWIMHASVGVGVCRGGHWAVGLLQYTAALQRAEGSGSPLVHHCIAGGRGRTVRCARAVRALCEKLAVLHHREFGKFRRLKGRH